MKSPKEIFVNAVSGNNFLTPYVIGYYKIKYGACELSSDSEENHFGVTVVEMAEYKFSLSKSFPTKKEAIEYIQTLQ